MLKISVITINYNNAIGLQKTMESVLTQTYSGFEYIIIDGGSTDGSKEIIEKNSGKLFYWVSEKDSGVYNAMNKGIQNATGDLIIFLNSGDYYVSPNVFQYAVNKMNIENADMFFARFIWDSPLSMDIILSDNNNIVYDWDLINANFPHPATFYKRSLFSKIGSFNEDYKILADYEWNVKALIQYRIPFQYLNIITVLFTADGISNSLDHKHLRDEESNKIFENYFQPVWLYNLINAQKDKFYKTAIEKSFAKIFNKKLNRI